MIDYDGRLMPLRVYLETSVISYLTGRHRRDVLTAARQRVTRQWWERRRGDFDLYVSEVVVREIRGGDPQAASERVKLIEGIPVLGFKEPVAALAEALVSEGLLPPKAADDALHVALAAVHGLDLLLTWNCRHIANAEILRPVNILLQREGWNPPIICTPYELTGDQDDG